MEKIEIAKQRLLDSIEVKQLILQDNSFLSSICSAADIIIESFSKGGKLVICGNGGSASDSLHFAAEIIGRFQKVRASWPAITLNSDVSSITAISNDFGYEEVFARQVEGLLKKEDIFIGISTSGNSENVYRAIKKAKKLGVTTIALLGMSGGRISKEVDLSIIVPSQNTARIQESHITIIHILCEIIENGME